jgi:hypothetical protein
LMTRGKGASPTNCLIGFSIPFMFTSAQRVVTWTCCGNLITKTTYIECLITTTSAFRDSTERRLRTLILRFRM